MFWSSQWFHSFWLSQKYPIQITVLPHSCYMPWPSHPSWLEHSNYTWRRVPVTRTTPTYLYFLWLQILSLALEILPSSSC
jgi:hypothetical protein